MKNDAEMSIEGAVPGAVADATRKLERKAEGSHPDAPGRQVPKQDGGESEEDMPQMMKKMMGMMGALSNDMQSVTAGVNESKAKAQEAVDIAQRTEGEVMELQDKGVTKVEWLAWRQVVEDKITAAGCKDSAEEVTPEFKQKLKDIENELASIRNKKKPNAEDRAVTMLVGGVGVDGDEDEAVDWISSQIKTLQIGEPEDIYFKGDAFKGMLFCKFDNSEMADKIIKELNKRKPEFKAKGSAFKPWFKQDAPIWERAPLSFLLGLRWQLGEWGEDKKNIKVDEKALTMKFKGEVVACASIQSDKFKVDWLDSKWTEWKELQDSAELKALVQVASKKIEESCANAAKGKGKGKGKDR